MWTRFDCDDPSIGRLIASIFSAQNVAHLNSSPIAAASGPNTARRQRPGNASEACHAAVLNFPKNASAAAVRAAAASAVVAARFGLPSRTPRAFAAAKASLVRREIIA